MYEIFEELLKERGLRVADVCKATGLSQSMMSDWKKGKYTPKTDKLQKIADFFGIPLETFTSDRRKTFTATFHKTKERNMFFSKEELVGKVMDAIDESVPKGHPVYYENEETARAAQEVFDDPDTRMLFDAARNASPEAIRLAAEMLKTFKKTNPDG